MDVHGCKIFYRRHAKFILGFVFLGCLNLDENLHNFKFEASHGYFRLINNKELQ